MQQVDGLKKLIKARNLENSKMNEEITEYEEKISSHRLQKLELRLQLRDLFAKMLRMHFWQYPENENYMASYFIKSIWKVRESVKEDCFPNTYINKASVEYLIEVRHTS